MNFSSYFKYKLGQEVRNKKSPDETVIIRKRILIMGDRHYLIETKAGGKVHPVIASEGMIELVNPHDDEKICIIRHGNKIIAKDLNSARVGVARCNPSDTFDYATGAKIAIERLFGVEEVSVPGYEKKPPMLNCKFVLCSNFARMTKGKIYEVKDGRYLDDVGRSFPMYGDGLHTFEELEAFIKAPIVEVKE